MLSDFLTFVNTYQLFQPTDRVLLAISGGLDSVVMSELFHLAKREGQLADFAMAHTNFGLRAEESDADEAFVKKLAKKYRVPFYIEHFDTPAFAEAAGVSIQMAARLLRYRWFDDLLDREGFQVLATAHHQNDALETVLLNLTKGTGIAGLHGILPKRGRVIRPLGFANKERLYDFVVEKQLPWREDESNASNKYQRNLIRNEVVPLLKQINPNLEQTFDQTIAKVRAVEHVFQSAVEQLRREVEHTEEGAVFLQLVPLRQALEPLVMLHALLAPFHFSYAQTTEVWEARDKEPGKMFLSPTHTLVKDRTALVITPQSLMEFGSVAVAEGQSTVTAGGLRLELTTVPRHEFTLLTGPSVACLDAGALQFPLQLRKWKEGDWFCPLGMNQKKKLSDFLIDAKVPLNQKPQVWVLTSNSSIVWIVGHRLDNRFKVTDKTEQVLVVKRA